VWGQALVLTRPGELLSLLAQVMDITGFEARGRNGEAAMARERELFAQQRATELAKANEALRGMPGCACLGGPN